MKRYLIVLGMQKDYIDGALGCDDAKEIEQKILKKLDANLEEYAAVYFVKTLHYENYLDTLAGHKMPVEHCMAETDGARFTSGIDKAIKKLKEKKRFVRIVVKHTFASTSLTDILSCVTGRDDVIEIVGLYTDDAVISTALSIRQALPNRQIEVDASCCMGTGDRNHNAACDVMRSCHIDIV